MSPTLKHIRKWKLLSTNDAEAVDLFRSIEKTKKKDCDALISGSSARSTQK